MLTIRLSRTGKRHKPQYRIVVQEKHQDPWAPAKEVVGLYNPHTQPSTIELNEESIKGWLEKGAAPSESVHNMLINAGIIKAEKAPVVTISNKRRAKLDEKKAEAEEKVAEEKAAAEAKAEEEKAAEEAATPEETSAPEEETPAEAQEEKKEEEKTEEAPKEEAKEEASEEKSE